MSPLPPYVVAGGTAVVTGAASGIGEQLAHQLAARGSAVVLVDRDAERLGEVVQAITTAHPDAAVDAHVADLADLDGIADLAASIIADHPRLTLLVNNAGVALMGRFDQISLAEFTEVVRINFLAPVTLTHHLLDTLLATPGSHIVNVSSLYGLIAPPGQSAYAASKFAVRGFSQVLQAELRDRGTGVTTVHPGGIRTRIATSARRGAGVDPAEVAAGQRLMAHLLTYPPEKAAAEILAAVEQRRVRLLIARTATVPDLLARLLPVGHTRLLRLLMQPRVRRGPAAGRGRPAPDR